MTVRGCGVRDIAVIAKVSIGKVLSTIGSSIYKIVPKKRYYERLEVDEFWTYVYRKKRKVWLIYAYDRATNEIVAYVWGKRDLKTAQKLRARLKQLKVSYGSISMDNWDSFITAFKPDNKRVGKQHTVGIEGNNCRLRHRLRRSVRKTCCFSKSLIITLKYSIWCSFISIMAMSDVSILFRTPPIKIIFLRL